METKRIFKLTFVSVLLNACKAGFMDSELNLSGAPSIVRMLVQTE